VKGGGLIARENVIRDSAGNLIETRVEWVATDGAVLASYQPGTELTTWRRAVGEAGAFEWAGTWIQVTS
jgi:hypothetical protein